MEHHISHSAAFQAKIIAPRERYFFISSVLVRALLFVAMIGGDQVMGFHSDFTSICTNGACTSRNVVSKKLWSKHGQCKID